MHKLYNSTLLKLYAASLALASGSPSFFSPSTTGLTCALELLCVTTSVKLACCATIISYSFVIRRMDSTSFWKGWSGRWEKGSGQGGRWRAGVCSAGGRSGAATTSPTWDRSTGRVGWSRSLGERLGAKTRVARGVITRNQDQSHTERVPRTGSKGLTSGVSSRSRTYLLALEHSERMRCA